jgi:DNA topoisomerase-1
MGAAQKLYQKGKITYMRTDSVNLSGQALNQMTDYITSSMAKNTTIFERLNKV